MTNSAEQMINTRAAAWTAGAHILLLLLFLLIKYSSPVASQPVQELGMEVNLGTVEEGSGEDQPMNTEDPAAAHPTNVYKAAAATNDAPTREVLQSDDNDAPAISNTAKTRKQARNIRQTQSTKAAQQEPRQANTNSASQKPKYVYSGGTGKGGNSSTANSPGQNEGNGTGPGDKGVPGGTPGASNYTGVPGSGNGISHTLSRRSIIAFPPPEAEFREGGKVVIRITVNRNGAITNKQVVSASNGELRTIALKKIEKVKFNKSEDAPEEQFGNITFVFKTRS